MDNVNLFLSQGLQGSGKSAVAKLFSGKMRPAGDVETKEGGDGKEVNLFELEKEIRQRLMKDLGEKASAEGLIAQPVQGQVSVRNASRPDGETSAKADDVLAILEQNPELVKAQPRDVQEMFRKIEELKALYGAASSDPQSGVNLNALMGEIARTKEALAGSVDPKALLSALKEADVADPPVADPGGGEKPQALRERDDAQTKPLGPERPNEIPSDGTVQVAMKESLQEPDKAVNGMRIEELWVRRQLDKALFGKAEASDEAAPEKPLDGTFHKTLEGVFSQPIEGPAVAKKAELKPAIVEQVADRMRGAIETLRFSPNGTKQTVEIQLHPPELGKMKIDMEMVQNEVRVNVHVERDAVKGMLDQSVAWLKESLERRDLKLTELNVQLRHEGSPSSYGHFNQSGRKEQSAKEERESWKSVQGKSDRVEVARVGASSRSDAAQSFFMPGRFMRRTIDLVA